MKTIAIAISLLLLVFSSLSLAEIGSIQDEEQQLLEKIKKLEFYGSNYEFMMNAKQLIKTRGIISFNYDFPLFQENLRLFIEYPLDRTFKTYTFNLSGSAAVEEYQSYIQFKDQPSLLIGLMTMGVVEKIDQIMLNQQPVYLIQSHYGSPNCTGVFSIKAFKVKNNQLIGNDIFPSKNKVTNEIKVDYDCNIDRELESSYIELSADKKTLSVQFLTAQLRPEAKYLRYVLKPNGYIYQGVFNQ